MIISSIFWYLFSSTFTLLKYFFFKLYITILPVYVVAHCLIHDITVWFKISQQKFSSYHIWSSIIPTIDQCYQLQVNVIFLGEYVAMHAQWCHNDKCKEGTPMLNTYMNSDFQMSIFHLYQSMNNIISSLSTFTILSEVCISNLQCKIWQFRGIPTTILPLYLEYLPMGYMPTMHSF